MQMQSKFQKGGIKFPVVQWLGLHTSRAGVTGSIPGWETKNPTCCMVQQKKFQKGYVSVCMHMCIFVYVSK